MAAQNLNIFKLPHIINWIDSQNQAFFAERSEIQRTETRSHLSKLMVSVITAFTESFGTSSQSSSWAVGDPGKLEFFLNGEDQLSLMCTGKEKRLGNRQRGCE